MKGEKTPMGQKDHTTKEYIRQRHIFADAFNFYIYGGRPVINPASLEELDTSGIVDSEDSIDEIDKPIERTRDSIKSLSAMSDDNGTYVILAVESQSHVHYAMPARVFMYDAMQYTKQVKEIAAKHMLEGKQKGVSNDEYISGFYKGDKLLPVITLVIYFADKEWDGPMSLYDMFERQDEHLMPLVQDYKLNLIAPAFLRDEDFDMFHSSLKEVLLFIKYSKDKKKAKELVERDEAFRHMDRDAVKVINKCTGAKLPVREEEETVDMCQAIKDLMEDAAAEAREEAAKAKEEAINAKAEATNAKAEATSAKAEAAKAAEEKISILLKSVKAFMEKTGMSLEETLSTLDISKIDREKLMPLL
jgi:hypothetical protein